MSDELKKVAANIKLLLMDVDGVMTDGKLYNVVDQQGHVSETKGFDSQDGIGLQWLSWHGIKTGLISGRTSQATEVRATQCKMTFVRQGHIEKLPVFKEILHEAGVTPDEVAYIGDDLTDTVILTRVGLPIAVANARPEVKKIARYVTTSEGGSGAVREVVEMLLQAKGLWAEILTHYGIQG